MSARRKKIIRKKLYSGIVILLIISLSLILITNKAFIARIHLLFTKSNPESTELSKTITRLSDYSVFGIDVSEYQDVVVWKKLVRHEDVDFVFIRATAGIDYRDKYFTYNWRESAENNLIRGAYHYYRPDENSIMQANNFINNVALEKGDLPPVLDIEEYSDVQSLSSLMTGLLRWLDKVEQHYEVQPIIYTYFKFYTNHLKDDERFDKYQFWLARYSYNNSFTTPGNSWMFWQYSKHGVVSGVSGDVDLNVYQGESSELKQVLIK